MYVFCVSLKQLGADFLRRISGSILGDFIRNYCWMKCQWKRFLSLSLSLIYFGFPSWPLFHYCPMLIHYRSLRFPIAYTRQQIIIHSLLKLGVSVLIWHWPGHRVRKLVLYTSDRFLSCDFPFPIGFHIPILLIEMYMIPRSIKPDIIYRFPLNILNILKNICNKNFTS